MKGDFSRIRFEPNKHYTDVLDQQGRIAYDADHNEQRLIDKHRRTVETIDVIGDYGAPMHDAGFAISLSGKTLRIGTGRYYVHGLLCENARALDYDDQPFLIEGSDADDIGELLVEMLRARTGCLRVYLEVWQRMVTALDDSCLGEPALGQADTTVRLQTVWRVVAGPTKPASSQPAGSIDGTISGVAGAARKIKGTTASSSKASATTAVATSRFGTLESEADSLRQNNPCSCAAMYQETPVKHTGMLSAQVADNDGDCGCQPIPAAGYTGQENQLYRFEIQRSGTLATATLKWSRENGSVAVAILSVSGSKVVVNSLGMDANLGFQEGQWVEISDDTDLFGVIPNLPGKLYQIQGIDRPSMTLTMTTTVQPIDPARNARMRRWDQSGTAATADGIALSDNWITIENGIQVRFGKGHYVAGDAWTVPARSATGQIDWPPCGSDGKPFQPPHYAHVYRAPLACIHFDNADVYNSVTTRADAAIAREAFNPFEVDDCRRLFPSLADLGFVDATALHVTRINWKNDDVMTFDALVKSGLLVAFDTVPTGPLSPANFIVTLETPMLLQTQADATSALLGVAALSGAAETSKDTTAKASISVWGTSLPTPSVIRAPFILDSTVARHGKTIAWTLPSEKVSPRQLLDLEAINAALVPWAHRGTPVRVRVKLPGHVLYAAQEGGKQLYLDGQAFGKSVRSTTEDRERIDLSFPSGSDERASDFESWFYLYPALAIQSVDFTYDQVTIGDVNDTATIIASDPAAKTKPIVQQATIELNYVAVETTTIQLSMSGDASIASVPAEVAVKAGKSTITVNVTINGAPDKSDKPVQFVLTASLPSVLGQATSQTASFTATERGFHSAQLQSATGALATATTRKAKTATKPAAATTRKSATRKATPAKRRATTKRKPT